MRLRRDQTFSIRLCRTELALLGAIRQGCAELPSQADVVAWALEDLCARIAAGEDCNIALRDGAHDRCAQAVEALRFDRYVASSGRPPRATLREGIPQALASRTS